MKNKALKLRVTMSLKIAFNAFCLFFITSYCHAQAACTVKNSQGQIERIKNDVLSLILSKAVKCPENVQNLKAIVAQAGFVSKPHMVANRGIHNPRFGSFSFFEQVTGSSQSLDISVNEGEFFFGHFTTAENNQVVADQKPSKGKLLIELIVWDRSKKLFNFYELIGTGKGAQWFYRGDTKDILEDNAAIHLNSEGPPQFGSKLRCSACHTSGGPIMKEIEAPFNDWWTNTRPLTFSPNKPSPEIQSWIGNLKDASEFSRSVKEGISLLNSSIEYQILNQKLSFQAQARPLFCEMEINLESDIKPLDLGKESISIPTSFVVNPLLAKDALQIPRTAYESLLTSFGMRFPEIQNRQDADHAWLTPAKGYSDLLAIESLIQDATISEEFAADVLAVDMENPLFSEKRCNLLKLLPKKKNIPAFIETLKTSSLPAAQELYENLTNPLRNESFHMQTAKAYIERVQLDLQLPDFQMKMFKQLLNIRQNAFESDISKNPNGQILEPGFRVIFPVAQ